MLHDLMAPAAWLVHHCPTTRVRIGRGEALVHIFGTDAARQTFTNFVCDERSGGGGGVPIVLDGRGPALNIGAHAEGGRMRGQPTAAAREASRATHSWSPAPFFLPVKTFSSKQSSIVFHFPPSDVSNPSCQATAFVDGNRVPLLLSRAFIP